MILTLLGFTSTANAQTWIEERLESYCGGYNTWQEVDINDWDMTDDWDEDFQDGIEVHPAGFRYYVLGHYNEPPICMLVPESSDKKVEVLIESPLENANLCIYDASYDQVASNNVGNVQNCGTGKVYACFTAATVGGGDLGFYVMCNNEGCEDSEVPVWIRIRVSDQSWSAGKTSTADDLEHWCEAERGTHLIEDDYSSPLYYTYPSDLVPDEPSNYPFHIHQIFGKNAGSRTSPSLWVTLAAFGLWLVIG